MYRYLLYFTGNATEVKKDVAESTTISLGTFKIFISGQGIIKS